MSPEAISTAHPESVIVSPVLVYAIIDLRSSSDHPLGDTVETFVRREDAERFIEEVRRDEPELAVPLSITFLFCQRTANRESQRRRGSAPRRRWFAQSAVIDPKSPWLSSSGPAVKKSVPVGPAAEPFPNSSAHSPSIEIDFPAGLRSSPRCSKRPFGSSL